jgi:hypothetical protein
MGSSFTQLVCGWLSAELQWQIPGRLPAVPVEAKPLFRPEVLRTHVVAFSLPPDIDACRPKLEHWTDLISSGRADAFKE